MSRYAAYLPLIVVGLIALVPAVYLKNPAENHPVRVSLIVGIPLLLAAAVWWLFASDGFGWALPGVILLGCVWGVISGWDARDNYLTPYCEYGAKTAGQRDACLDHVNTEDIDKLHTVAARFARGEITTCGPGHGPFCDRPGEGP